MCASVWSPVCSEHPVAQLCSLQGLKPEVHENETLTCCASSVHCVFHASWCYFRVLRGVLIISSVTVQSALCFRDDHTTAM